MSALGGIANLANAVGRFGEIRKLMNCDLAGARMLGLPCFVAGTLVSTPDGPRAIESILSGDTVWGFDQRRGQWRSCMVSYHSSIAYDDLVVTVRSNGAEVRSTYHHPYWVVSGEELDVRPVPEMLGESGMEIPGVPGRWVDAGDLRVGDVLFSRETGTSTVESVDTEHQPVQVFHIYVEELHNYAVGDSQWLVHNGHHADWELRGPQGGLIASSDELSGVDFPLRGRGRLSFPEQSWYGHTEGKIIDDLSEAGHLRPGRTLVIQGELPPCANCQGIMRWASEQFGMNIYYQNGNVLHGWASGFPFRM